MNCHYAILTATNHPASAQHKHIHSAHIHQSSHSMPHCWYTLLHVWLYHSGIAVLFTQLAIAIRDWSHLPTVKLFCQNQTSFAKKWIKYYIIEVLPMKHSQNQYKLSDSYSYMQWDKKCCFLKPAAATFACGVKSRDYKVQDSGWEYPAVFNLANQLNCILIQGVPGGKDLTSGECSLGQTITI